MEETSFWALVTMGAWAVIQTWAGASWLCRRAQMKASKATVVSAVRTVSAVITGGLWTLIAGFAAMVLSIPFGGPHAASREAGVLMIVVLAAGLAPLRFLEWRGILACFGALRDRRVLTPLTTFSCALDGVVVTLFVLHAK